MDRSELANVRSISSIEKSPTKCITEHIFGIDKSKFPFAVHARRTPPVGLARAGIFSFCWFGLFTYLYMGEMLMKKLKPVDVLGYNAEEFDE